jgi:hypothetical protein
MNLNTNQEQEDLKKLLKALESDIAKRNTQKRKSQKTWLLDSEIRSQIAVIERNLT